MSQSCPELSSDQFDVESRYLAESDSDFGTEICYNQSESMDKKVSDQIGSLHEKKTTRFIMKQLEAQEHLKWEKGCSQSLRLPSHKVIDGPLNKLEQNLKNHFTKLNSEGRASCFTDSDFDIKPLAERNSLQIDLVFFVKKKDASQSDFMVLSDGKVTYHLRLPCIFQVEATSNNHLGRLFDKFLRGQVNTAHLLAWPMMFFYSMDSLENISKLNLYYLLVSGGDWLEGTNNVKEFYETVLNENKDIMSLLRWHRFEKADLVEEFIKDMDADRMNSVQWRLQKMPFGLLNIADLNLEAQVTLSNGVPQFRLQNKKPAEFLFTEEAERVIEGIVERVLRKHGLLDRVPFTNSAKQSRNSKSESRKSYSDRKHLEKRVKENSRVNSQPRSSNYQGSSSSSESKSRKSSNKVLRQRRPHK